MNLDSFFDNIEAYIAAAKSKAADAAEKAAKSLEELAAWVRAQSAPLVGASPTGVAAIDKTRLAACATECQALAAPAVGATPTVGAGGVWAALLAKLIASILESLK